LFEEGLVLCDFLLSGEFVVAETLFLFFGDHFVRMYQSF
jgi:hypothetical protein